MSGWWWCVLAALAPGLASGADIDTLAQTVDARVQAWRRDLHQHPELGNRETRTAQKVAEHLRSLGLEPRTGVAHTGVPAFSVQYHPEASSGPHDSSYLFQQFADMILKS